MALNINERKPEKKLKGGSGTAMDEVDLFAFVVYPNTMVDRTVKNPQMMIWHYIYLIS